MNTSSFICSFQKLNKWMNEQTFVELNNGTNEQTCVHVFNSTILINYINNWTIEQMNKWPSEQMFVPIQQLNEWTNQQMNESTNVCSFAQFNKWTNVCSFVHGRGGRRDQSLPHDPHAPQDGRGAGGGARQGQSLLHDPLAPQDGRGGRRGQSLPHSVPWAATIEQWNKRTNEKLNKWKIYGTNEQTNKRTNEKWKNEQMNKWATRLSGLPDPCYNWTIEQTNKKESFVQKDLEPGSRISRILHRDPKVSLSLNKMIQLSRIPRSEPLCLAPRTCRTESLFLAKGTHAGAPLADNKPGSNEKHKQNR